ncbi:hypothetical protein MRB53_032303 [Persea americana]|uniref:Uncharacterized protein n=1 Tax=Persea americana TaxID=3435 RepID=A0ACC2KS06_PERAE|nr:hypothetical protein MRB53_032303 [Persea americana]|eukprot:TRINITY_DN12017_c2_g1_i2.p1 TRINITY_DN12017_c2_g1~~TRINITY_DN12017_c2_g1_i2.p1  ORF type:complete len:201 (-),score=40.02 TRINITY_DN12017_c2_g1_i2:118-720(-)
MGSGAGSPCGACKFLRRKCASDCIFAPYFCSEQGPARFAAIHKIFGASNVSKLLMHVPLAERCEAVVTIAYEAQARIRDPVYGCVAHIFALQQQVASLQAQLMQLRAQMAQNSIDPRLLENYCPTNIMGDGGSMNLAYPNIHSMSPQSSIDSGDHSSSGPSMMQDVLYREDVPLQPCIKRRTPQDELNELQALALTMMRN